MENRKQYPQWIDEYAKSMHNAFSHMIPANWGPIDFYAVYKALNGTSFDKIYEAIQKVKNKPIKEVVASFTCPSIIRCGALLFFAVEYQFCTRKEEVKEKFKTIVEFLINALKEINKKDIFAYSSNICHTDEEIKDIVKKIPWRKGNPKDAKNIGRMYNSLFALVYSLYGDFYPEDSNEVYGPYNLPDNQILLIKHFPKLKAAELWPDNKNLKYSDIKIYQIFRNVKFKCEMIGMHSLYEGDITNGLVRYAVEVDGQFVSIDKVKELAEELALTAIGQTAVYEKMTQEQIATKVLEWNYYQFFGLFKLAGLDWRPTEEMLNAVKGKKFANRIKFDSFPPYEEYINSPDYEVYWIKKLYNN